MIQSLMRRSTPMAAAFSMVALAACNAPAGKPAPVVEDLSHKLGAPLAQDETGTPAAIPSGADTTPPAVDGPTPDLGESCHSNDPDKICLSLKYVVYKDSQGAPVADDAQILANLSEINDIWSQCGIGFEIGERLQADPADYGLLYNTSSMGELTTIRDKLNDGNTLLVVSTGTWAGSLGAGSANAWAAMPGGGPYGVVLEAPVADTGNLVAHELGHYLNLDHYGDTSDVMNPVIYSSSRALTTAQCTAARDASVYYWAKMMR